MSKPNPTRSDFGFGPETVSLFLGANDDSAPLEKALFHLLAYANERTECDTPLSIALANVEHELVKAARS